MRINNKELRRSPPTGSLDMGAGSSSGISPDELEKLKASTAFSSREIKDLYDKFHRDYPDGVINKEQFVEMYQEMFPKGDARLFAEHIFRAYDVDKNGVIDFKEFMCTLNITSNGSVEDKLRWAFHMYDIDGDGCLTRREVAEIITSIYKLKGKEGGPEKAEQTAMNIFIQMDRNKDDKLTQAEFLTGAKHSKSIMNLLQASGGGSHQGASQSNTSLTPPS